MTSRPPDRIGAYTLDRELGRGGTGVVYLGHDTRVDRPVTIEVMPEESRLAAIPGEIRVVTNFLDEIRRVAGPGSR